jgi:cysteine sulfinate desulfinase/cysteine desulfurase-like protein
MESPAIKEIYIDNNATTIPRVEVREAVLGAMGPSFGNPSSVH